MVIIVCPEVKTPEMAEIVIEQARKHVGLIVSVCKSFPTKEEVNAFLYGWKYAEMLNPVMKTVFSQLYHNSKVYMIIDFDMKGNIVSMTPMEKEHFL